MNFLMKMCAKYIGWYLMKNWPNHPVERNEIGFQSFKKELSKAIKQYEN